MAWKVSALRERLRKAPVACVGLEAKPCMPTLSGRTYPGKYMGHSITRSPRVQATWKGPIMVVSREESIECDSKGIDAESALKTTLNNITIFHTVGIMRDSNKRVEQKIRSTQKHFKHHNFEMLTTIRNVYEHLFHHLPASKLVHFRKFPSLSSYHKKIFILDW